MVKKVVIKCKYCSKVFEKQEQANECYINHDILFVPISRSDLNRLINFMYIGETKLLTKTLSDTLMKSRRHKA